MVVIDGEEVVYPINQEIVTIRGTIQGEYVVNLYYYKAYGTSPIPVSVKVEKVNPEFRLVFVDQVVLESEDAEKTVVRFTVTAEREIAGINRVPRMLTPYHLEP